MSSSMHIACPHCNGVNRVPSDRIGESPNCGVCHQPLLHGKPVDLDQSNFAIHVENTDLPVLVDFWAPWCGPCRMMAPVYAETATRFATTARFAKVNTEEARQLGAQYGIKSIPTLVLFRQGKEIARVAGAMGPPQLQSWLQQQLSN